MNNYENIDFSDLLAMSEDEVITHAYVRDVTLASGKILALVTLDNGKDYKRPNTLGPATLVALGNVFDELKKRADAKEIHAVAITGKNYDLAAGADLSKVSDIPSVAIAKKMAQLGHYVLGKQSNFGVPSFAFVNGLALGGGVEIALNADYRTLSSSVPAFALPEVFLGIIPGWGGAWLLPNLIGIENALEVVISNPLKQNRMLRAHQVLEYGIVDEMFEARTFLEDSLAWADDVINAKIKVQRKHQPGKTERLIKWPIAIKTARGMLEDRIGKVPLSPYKALDLLEKAGKVKKAEGFALEDEALSELIGGDQFAASMYAFDLVQKRAKKPTGAPDKELAHPIRKVGVIGAGLMASQFALLFLRRLEVPVVITDLDQSRVDKGIEYIRTELQKLVDKGRMDADTFNKLVGNLSGTVNRSDFADCDWIIEAVFEDLQVKQDVFQELEGIVSETAILATNTSSLSVTKMAQVLKNPERVVGFHFFNPVAVMPLIEVVKTESTSDETLSTAIQIAAKLRKNAIITADAPGFVVNRILAKVLGEAMNAVDTGTPFDVVDKAAAPIGLPMPPFQLLELVGLKVGAHVLDSHHAAFPDRFFASENLHKLAEYGKLFERDGKGRIKDYDPEAKAIVAGGTSPMTEAELLQRIEDGLADEIKRILDDGVVTAVEDVDLALILGAGYPFHAGGITPYLDRVGASERVFGRTFHSPPIRGVSEK